MKGGFNTQVVVEAAAVIIVWVLMRWLASPPARPYPTPIGLLGGVTVRSVLSCSYRVPQGQCVDGQNVVPVIVLLLSHY